MVQLLRHGSDPLLYDYSGNMPIDLAKESEDRDLLDYFSAILSDLHGKKSSRWSVCHDPGFVLPQSQDLDVPDSDSEEEPLFEVTSQPLPPQFTLSQYPQDKFMLASDLKMEANKMKQLTTVKMSNEEFVKSAFCCLVGSSFNPGNKDLVVLVKVDSTVKKFLAIDDSKLFHNLNISPTSKSKKSSS